MAILRSIKLGTALAALALFFLPWLEIQCSGKILATQTGFQTIVGEATPSEEMKANQKQDGGKKEPLGTASLVAAALIAVGLAVAFLLVALLRGNPLLDGVGCALCALALALLVLQAIEGFPAKDELTAAISADSASNEVDVGSSLAMAVMANLQVEILPAFYITCILLGIPALILTLCLLNRLGESKPQEKVITES